jgi:hypothetical protein
MFPDSNPIELNKPMGIWVNGQGKSKQVFINWGDGQTKVINNASLPIHNTPHTYKKAGPKRIQVFASDCKGKPVTHISVLPPSSSTQSLLCRSPKIKNVVSFTGFPTRDIRPNQRYMINGCGFGSQKGQVRLLGKQFTTDMIFDIIDWKDNAITIKLPTVTKAPDQMAEVVLTKPLLNSGGKESNKHQIPFYALREVKELLSADVGYRCGPGAGTRGCRVSAASTMSAEHAAGSTRKTPLVGVDKVMFRLLNGWTLKGVKNWAPHAGGGKIDYPKGVKKGTNAGIVEVQYSVSPGKSVNYYLTLEIQGPKGLPYK